MSLRTTELRCAHCGATVPIAAPLSWRCPNATLSDRRHALRFVTSGTLDPPTGIDGTNPFETFRSSLAWDAFAAANGMDEVARAALVQRVDAAVAAVAGTGFVVTPFTRAEGLSDALGFGSSGGVWVKDETHAVGGSHKARHLFTILLHLLAAEEFGLVPWASESERPLLAISSCGNAAIAAATLAAAVRWPIEVFVPTAADVHVTSTLASLGASVVPCPRLISDPPGDPCIFRFREAVARDAIPFTVQGPENAWCLDGGRTLGWEIVAQASDGFDRLLVQVGGGALAACVFGAIEPPFLAHPVQTRAAAPLARAVDRLRTVTDAGALAGSWDGAMWPWEHVGPSAADGILDDETYDGLAVVEAMRRAGGGSAVVVDEADVILAHDLAWSTTGITASHTGTAGLAGLLALRAEIGDDERVAVIFSGTTR